VPHRRPRARCPRRRAALCDVARVAARARTSARGGARTGGRTVAVSVADLDLRGVSEALARRELSSVEATQSYLRRIAAHDGVLRSYITVTGDMALAQANEADAELRRGRRRGLLHGVPIALKDLIAVA